jgi:hypothetical protein
MSGGVPCTASEPDSKAAMARMGAEPKLIADFFHLSICDSFASKLLNMAGNYFNTRKISDILLTSANNILIVINKLNTVMK